MLKEPVSAFMKGPSFATASLPPKASQIFLEPSFVITNSIRSRFSFASSFDSVLAVILPFGVLATESEPLCCCLTISSPSSSQIPLRRASETLGRLELQSCREPSRWPHRGCRAPRRAYRQHRESRRDQRPSSSPPRSQ